MKDLLLIALMTAFFLAAIGLLRVCRRVVNTGSVDEPGHEDPVSRLAAPTA